jgi:hypothetical protein
MDKTTATLAAAMAALACAGIASAHHSQMMFDISTPVWVKGTVVRYQPIDPHALVTLDETTADGQVKRWLMEGPTAARLKRMGAGPDFLKAGDVIEVCGFAWKKEFSSRVPPAAIDTSYPSIHAHMLVMPDGRMRLFGPYGKLDNCIRPGDSTESWAEFLNRDPEARDRWCRGLNNVNVPSLPPKAFVDEVNKRIAQPCG